MINVDWSCELRRSVGRRAGEKDSLNEKEKDPREL